MAKKARTKDNKPKPDAANGEKEEKKRPTTVINVKPDLAKMLGRIAALEGTSVAEVVEECTPFRAFVRSRFLQAIGNAVAESQELAGPNDQ